MPRSRSSVVEVVAAPDLGDRTITIVPPRIEEEARKEENDVLSDFGERHPEILGALLDAASHGLRILPDLKLDKLPRMADFAKWAAACEGAYAEKGSFMKAYAENRANAMSALLENEVVASVVVKLALPWQGQIGALLPMLTGMISVEQAKSQEWPKTPRGLSSVLRRIMPLLREHGIMVEPPLKNDKTRTWQIWAVGGPAPPKQPEQQPESKPLKTREKTGVSGGVGGSGCSFPYFRERQGNGADRPHSSIIGKQQPEQPKQPEVADSVNGPNSLGLGNLSCCCPHDSPEQPERQTESGSEPDGLDIPQFLDRRNCAPAEAQHCEQCHGRIDSSEQPHTVRDRRVWLHDQCVRFYRAGQSRIDKR
jgi:hypothetical protein